MRVRFYNKNGDLVLGLNKVKNAEVNPDRDVKVTIKDYEGRPVEMKISRTDYNRMVIGNLK